MASNLQQSTDQAAAAEPLTWSVNAQMASTVDDGQGHFVPGYQVRFTLSNGHADQVDIPASQYTAANVKAAIQAKVDEIAAVYSLTGTAGGG